MNNRPYVISAELDMGVADMNEIIDPVKLEEFRTGLDADLRSMGKETEWVGSATMQAGIDRLLSATTVPIVSLDKRYVRGAASYIGISRGVNEDLGDVGYVPRRGYAPIGEQLAQLSRLGPEVLIADDVVFSGEMLAWLAAQLETYGVRVGGVVCGIAIQEGIDKLEAEGIPVEAVRVFGEVEDEICERDFAFVSGSGRRLEAADMNALYFDDIFGRPSTWASIPENAAPAFCTSSLLRNVRLLRQSVPGGNFLGYSKGKTAVQQLQQRLQQQEERQ